MRGTIHLNPRYAAQIAAQVPKVKRSKYHNVKIELDGRTFDSQKEFNRYGELKLLERAGLISELKLQVPFELIPVQVGGLRKERPLTYVADFTYIDEHGKLVIEDTKGVKTKDYIIKRKLMKMADREIVEV